MGTLSKLIEFLQLVLETTQNSNGENREINENCSPSDPHPEVGVSFRQCSQQLSPD